MSLRLASAALLLTSAALASSCTRSPSDDRPPPDPRTILTLPTKDDVALIDGRALTLTSFSRLKAAFPKASNESLLWLGLGSMALQSSARSKGFDLGGQSALNVARFAAGELSVKDAETDLRTYYQKTGILPGSEQVRREIETLLQDSSILRNPQALLEFHDR